MTDNLTDSAIMDLFTPILQNPKYPYFDKINGLISKGNNSPMIIEFQDYDIPIELQDSFWKQGGAELILKCLNQKVREVFESIYNKDDNPDLDYDKIETKLIVDDKLVSKIHVAKDEKVLNKKIVVFDGIVVSKSNVLPEIVNPVYKCYSCGHTHDDDLRKCPNCDSKKIDISPEDSEIIKTEYLTIQEHQNDMIKGEIELEKIDVAVRGPLTKRFFLGNHVRVTGFPKIFNPKGNSLTERVSKGYNKSVIVPSNLSVVVESHNIQHMKTPLEIILSNTKQFIGDDYEKVILNLRRKYNDLELLNILVNSFAPNIYGLQILKESLLLQAVGGGKAEGKRSRIHVLIVGDPGMAKTQLALEYKKILLHAVMAVGYGSSGVGLTVSIININGQPRPSIGAAVLANGGVLILDELSGVSEENREHLRQAMENQSVSINKNGVNETFKADISLLAITNPDEGRYSSSNSLTENIKISPPLLSRFDLIFVVTDKINSEEEQKLNVHATAMWNETKLPDSFIKQTAITSDSIDQDLLMKYLIYANYNNQKVKILPEAYKRFDEFYKDLRRPKKSSDITATRRQYDGIYRIATAITRLLLKNEVTEEIAEYTIKLLNHAYESAGMKLGNSTGLNQNMIYSQDLKTMKDKKKMFMMVMENLTKGNTIPAEREDVVLELSREAELPISESYELFDKMVVSNRLDRMDKGMYLINRDIS